MPSTAAAFHPHPLSATLRIVAGLALLGAAALAGWLGRSSLAIAALIIVFAASFVLGRTTAWTAATRRQAPWPGLPSLLLTLAIQGVFVGGLYLLGAGLAAVSGRSWMLQPPSRMDVLAPLVLGVVCGAMAMLAAGIDRRRRGAHGVSSMQVSAPGRAELLTSGSQTADGPLLREEVHEEIRVQSEPVTPETFYSGIHYSHGRHVDGAYDGSPNAASAGSDEKIEAAEERLGVALPDGLRRLYRMQNGGSLSNICIPKAGVASPRRYDDILTPFGGYNDLQPTEALTTAWDSFLAFADPEDRDTYGSLFTGGTERMIVLAQWYRKSLVLDYNLPGEPRVGLMDFDDEAWAEHTVWWQDFERFFAQLRHYVDA